jgi:hypothetical protein
MDTQEVLELVEKSAQWADETFTKSTRLNHETILEHGSGWTFDATKTDNVLKTLPSLKTALKKKNIHTVETDKFGRVWFVRP